MVVGRGINSQLNEILMKRALMNCTGVRASHDQRISLPPGSELSATFDLLDMDKDGKLKRADIITLLRTIKVEPTKRDVDSIFSEMDSERKPEAFFTSPSPISTLRVWPDQEGSFHAVYAEPPH